MPGKSSSNQDATQKGDFVRRMRGELSGLAQDESISLSHRLREVDFAVRVKPSTARHVVLDEFKCAFGNLVQVELFQRSA